MALYHASIKTFSRSRGHSAVAAAAYRARSRIVDQCTGVAHDYTRHTGIVHIDLFAPTGAPAWTADPDQLWNAAEASETRVNARVARELELGLPAELNAEQRSALTADIARLLVDRYQVAVMAAIHASDAGGDSRNHHAHLLFSVRRLGPNGFEAKVRELDDRKTGPQEVETLRAAVAALTNAHLERAGRSERVDHRTLAAQARSAEVAGDLAQAIQLTRQPTRHAGKSATALHRRGGEAQRVSENHGIIEANRAGLAGYLTRAQGEGRLMATPAGSGLVQAQADRRRESASAQVRHPIGVSRSPIKLGMAQGAGSQVLNEQARAAEQTLRAQADMTRDYLAQLDESVRQVLEGYAQQQALAAAEIQALARHCQRDARCIGLLRRAHEARTTWERAQTRPLRRRDAHGAAMVATTQEQRAWATVQAEPQPTVWQQARRRAWAERRRRQRERLRQAQEREHQASKAVSDHAMTAYATTEREVHEAWQRLERQRLERYPLSSDPRPDPAGKAVARSPAPPRRALPEPPRRPTRHLLR